MRLCDFGVMTATLKFRNRDGGKTTVYQLRPVKT